MKKIQIGRFRRITTIDNTIECESCPIKLKKGTIIEDRSRHLRMLNLIMVNKGNVTVDEIEVKILMFDEYGNQIPANDGSNCITGTFRTRGCRPDETAGEEEIIILASEKVEDCSVMISRVLTAGNVELWYDETDYTVKNTDNVRMVSPKKNKRIRIGLLIALAAAIVLYGVILGGAIVQQKVIAPQRDRKFVEDCLKKENYDGAAARAEKMGDRALKEQVLAEAISVRISEGEYRKALDYAARSSDPSIYQQTMARVTDLLFGQGKYDEALDYASLSGSDDLRRDLYRRTVTHYADQCDYKTALIYVALSGEDDMLPSIYASAVEYYRGIGKYGAALDYATRSKDDTLIRSVYEPAVMQCVENEDYDTAARYIAEAGNPSGTAVTESLRAEIIAGADLSYLRRNTELFYPIMNGNEIRRLFAHPIGIRTEAIGITKTGTLTGSRSFFGWSEIVSAVNGENHTVGLKNDGTVISAGSNEYGACNVYDWQNITAIAAGEQHTVGLRADGTVVAVGSNDYNQCDVGEWTDIVQVAAGQFFTLGLKKDGTVVACGQNAAGQCEVSRWTEITQISCGDSHSLGLRSDGTVAAAGVGTSEKCMVGDWTDIVEIAAGSVHSVGIRRDGTVVMAGGSNGSCGSVSGWTDIIAVAAGKVNVLGVDRYGNVYCIGDGKADVSGMQNLVGSYF